MQTFTTATYTAATRAFTGATAALDAIAAALQRRTKSERGEGVISAAIAVLIMAVLGGLMFYAYRAIFNTSSQRVNAIVTDLSNQPIGG